MAKFIINQPSLNRAVNQIEDDWATMAMIQRQAYENEGTRTLQNAIRTLRVYDEGNLENNSMMKQDRIGNKIEWSFETRGVPYALFPRNGLGSSAGYGIRKYDVKGAVDMLKQQKILAPSLPTGNPRPRKPRDVNIPPLNQL